MSNDINDASVYDDNYTILSKIRKIMRQIKDLITRVTNLENAGGYSLPIASSSRLGGIKVGNNLTIREDGTLDAQAGGGGGDVSGKQDVLYGQLYNQETGEFDRTSLNDVQWNKDLIQAPDSGGSGTGDRKMQIPSMWALNQVYAEALNKGGGGGSTLQGNLVKVKGEFTFGQTGSSPLIPASMSSAGHTFPFVDIYEFRASTDDTFTIQLENVLDHTDTISLEIPDGLAFTFNNGCIRLYNAGTLVSNAMENPSFTYQGYIEMSFQDDTNYKEWYAIGQGSINCAWDSDTGKSVAGNINVNIGQVTNLTDNKIYRSSQSGASYSGQVAQYASSFRWYGYYVN